MPFASYASYGDILTTGYSARFCGDCCSGTHESWSQQFTCGGALRFTIHYNFGSAMTVYDRFASARSSGESTSFTVVTSAGSVYSYSGTWWYTGNALGWTGATCDEAVPGHVPAPASDGPEPSATSW